MGELKVTTIKRWIRRDEANGAWWKPLLGLSILGALLVWSARRNVQQPTYEHVSAKLASADIGNVSIKDVDGQHVYLEGLLPSEEAKEKAVETVLATKCGVLGSSALCPTKVIVDDVKVVETPKVVVLPRHYDSKITIGKDGAIHFVSDVPTEADKATLISEIETEFPGATHEITVVNGQPYPQYNEVRTRLLAGAKKLKPGVGTLNSGTLTFSGWVNTEDKDYHASLLGAFPEHFTGGTNSLNLNEAADACDKQFADLLSKKKIRFKSGSAFISKQSKKLITNLASIASNCPGIISIEGHTDDVGKDDMNQALSQRRTAAVAEALSALNIDSSRMESIGFGEKRPLATNKTAKGRAQNRRIEIRVKR